MMAQAQTTKKAESDFPIIYDQPEGTLKTYTRSGGNFTPSPYPEEGTQGGELNIVFSDDGSKVWFQNPISTYGSFDTWVEGTISKDGKTIDLPTGQNLRYESEFDDALQLAVVDVDLSSGDGHYDASATDVTFTIDGNTISMNGTSATHILGVVWARDKGWLGFGDFNTVWTLKETQDELITPPAGLQTSVYPFKASEYIGNEGSGSDYSADLNVGFDGDDVYIQGLDKYEPQNWAKGTLRDGVVTFPEQRIGTQDGKAIYLTGYDGFHNQPQQLQMDYDDENENFEATSTILLNEGRDNTAAIAYYQNAFIGERMPLVVPPDKTPEVYTFKANKYNPTSLNYTDYEANLAVIIDGNDVYIQGLSEKTPNGWIKGTIGDNGSLHFPCGQYQGMSETEEPIYLLGYNLSTSSNEDIVFDKAASVYASEDYIIINSRHKSLVYYTFYQPGAVLIPEHPTDPTDGINSVQATDNGAAEYFDLQGRRVSENSHGLLIRRSLNSKNQVEKVIR